MSTILSICYWNFVNNINIMYKSSSMSFIPYTIHLCTIYIFIGFSLKISIFNFTDSTFYVICGNYHLLCKVPFFNNLNFYIVIFDWFYFVSFFVSDLFTCLWTRWFTLVYTHVNLKDFLFLLIPCLVL